MHGRSPWCAASHAGGVSWYAASTADLPRALRALLSNFLLRRRDLRVHLGGEAIQLLLLGGREQGAHLRALRRACAAELRLHPPEEREALDRVPLQDRPRLHALLRREAESPVV